MLRKGYVIIDSKKILYYLLEKLDFKE